MLRLQRRLDRRRSPLLRKRPGRPRKLQPAKTVDASEKGDSDQESAAKKSAKKVVPAKKAAPASKAAGARKAAGVRKSGGAPGRPTEGTT